MITNKREHYRNGIKNFLNQELLFFADPDWQHREWSSAYGERFGARLLRFFSVWDAILSIPKELSISDRQLSMIRDLYHMINNFQGDNEHPERPNQYLALLNNSEWKQIQRYARQVYDTIMPTL